MRGAGALEPKRLPLVDAEAVLLVDDHEAQIEEAHGFAEEGVRADDNHRRARHGGEKGFLALRGAEATGEKCRA